MPHPHIYQQKSYTQVVYDPSKLLSGPRIARPMRFLYKPSKRSLHHFQSLPYEIRILIWELALVSGDPRVIEVGYYFKEWRCYSGFDRVTRYPTKTVVPTLLHVNSEARTLALRYYEPFTLDGTWTGT